MQEIFWKIIEKLEYKRKTAEQLIMENPQDELDRIQTQTAEDFASAYKDAIEIVKQEAEKYNNGWIPCSEQQPEESGTYNITAFDGGKYRTTNAMWQKRSESWNLKGQRAYWSVIAWQPLPAPYQPKGE